MVLSQSETVGFSILLLIVGIYVNSLSNGISHKADFKSYLYIELGTIISQTPSAFMRDHLCQGLTLRLPHGKDITLSDSSLDQSI